MISFFEFYTKKFPKAFGQSSVGLIPKFVVDLVALVNGISFSIIFSGWLLFDG